MKASRPRSVSSARRLAVQSPVSSEVLEGRRLFAAFAPDHGHAGHAFDAAIMMASRIPPMLAWQSQIAAYRATQQQQAAANATTALSSTATASTAVSSASPSPSVDTAAVAAVTSTPSGGTSVPVRFVTSPAVVLQARTTDLAPTAAVIDQVMTAANAPATGTATASADAAGAAPAFGSYTVKLADLSTGHTKTIESGLVDLLAVNASRASRLAAWEVNAAANARRVTSAEASADLTEGELPTINADDVLMQAALPIVPGDASMRPLWQRVALFTATGVVFAANWVIRRRQRKLALAAKA